MRDPLPTPPADESPLSQRMRLDGEQHASVHRLSTTDDNTAAGMALTQEASMYVTPASSPTTNVAEEKDTLSGSPDAARTDDDAIKNWCHSRDSASLLPNAEDSFTTDVVMPDLSSQNGMKHAVREAQVSDQRDVDMQPTTKARYDTQMPSPPRTATPPEELVPRGLAKVDLEFDRSMPTRGWDFTDKRPVMKCPSALFQPYSQYIGTQQSDRHTYNVVVTILTVDMDQCSMSGYLLINGLTPEHPTLQTFFTGQIVGGPTHRYSFRTPDPKWGANDKVDIHHWLRFPPWRHLSAHAKRDMRFEFPLNGEPWWTQEHVFMRWKEHFLVPDHKQSNITGASFEGFYYICLNLREGRISGVYFHSKSEK